MKLKKKAFKIDIDIYPCSFFVVFKDVKLLRSLLLQQKHPPTETQIDNILSHFNSDDFYGQTVPLDNGSVIIAIYNPECIYNTIPHEVFHAVHMYLDFLGMELTNESQEAYAYLTGYLNQKIFEQLK